jgi:hypothetical protein
MLAGLIWGDYFWHLSSLTFRDDLTFIFLKPSFSKINTSWDLCYEGATVHIVLKQSTYCCLPDSYSSLILRPQSDDNVYLFYLYLLVKFVPLLRNNLSKMYRSLQ